MYSDTHPLAELNVEVVGHAPIAQDQLCPRNAAIQEIGFYQSPEAPLLEMLDYQIPVEDHLVPG
jgi:hypothetical protein